MKNNLFGGHVWKRCTYFTEAAIAESSLDSSNMKFLNWGSMGSVNNILGVCVPIWGKIIFIFVNLFMKFNISFYYESISSS